LTPAEFRAVRSALGLTQETLAQLLDLAPRTIRSYEHGERRIPEVVILALARLSSLSARPEA